MVFKSLVGIIGGAGPFATLDIERKILNKIRLSLAFARDSDYPNLLVYQYTQFSETDDNICAKQYVSCAKLLESAGVNFILVACNSAHIYLPLIKATVTVEVINLIEEVVVHFNKHFSTIKKVGLLSTEATLKANLYQYAFKPYDILIVAPAPNKRKKVMKSIHLIKAGFNNIEKIHNLPLVREKTNYIDFLSDAIQNLWDKGCTHIILGCTELPIVIQELRELYPKIYFMDPNELAASAIINKVRTLCTSQDLI